MKNYCLFSAVLLLLSCNVISGTTYDDQNYALFAATIFKHPEFIKAREKCGQFNPKVKSKQSVACFLKEAKNNPRSPETQYFLGLAHVYDGNLSGTKKQYEVLRELSHNFSLLLLDVVAHIQPQWLDEFALYFQENN